jgi:uncharacterized protein (TIGR02271 family)
MNSTYTKTIVGVFETYAAAERAAHELVQRGFSQNDVQITSKDNFATEAARGNVGLTGADPTRHSAGGGISGFFRRMFGAGEDEDRTYADAINRGAAIVSVRADDNRIDMARDIIERYHPIDIDKKGGYGQETARRAGLKDTDVEHAIPVVEENLQVGKRTVQGGGVRVFSHIIEEPVEEEVNLREERIRVDRRQVDRPATEADLRATEEVIEVTETLEEPVINKQARVKEEVVVGKDFTTRTEKIRDTVRRTDVDVEEMGERRMSRDFDNDFRRDFATRYGSNVSATYEAYEPAYQYGYTAAGDPRYRGRNWDDVEETIKTDYLRNNPNSTWDQVKGAVRYGWEKVTRKR